MNNFEYKENNKQFVVSVGLQGKVNSIHELNKDYEHRYKDEVLVVKTIMLNDKDFEQFINDLLDDYNFIKDNYKLYKVETVDIDYARLDKVMLITSQGVDFGIIVDTQGYNYVKYTAYYKKIKTAHEKLLDLGYEHHEYSYGDVYELKESYKYNGLSSRIQTDNQGAINCGDVYIGLELSRILTQYLEELENDNT